MDMTVDSLLGNGKKKAFKNARFVFKSDVFSVECDSKFERLDSKKILPFEEYSRDKTTGSRVKGKKVGYASGTLQHFKAMVNAKGKWIADMDKPVNSANVEKVIMDKRTGDVKRKSVVKGLRYIKEVSLSTIQAWHIEDTYNIWTEEDCDNMLKVYEYLTERNLVGVYKFNPYGTEYNAFLVPQRVDGGRFRLLLKVARVKIDKPDITPTMIISNAKAREREKTRTDEVGTMSALEEV